MGENFSQRRLHAFQFFHAFFGLPAGVFHSVIVASQYVHRQTFGELQFSFKSF
jgi:hypothetical protein